MKVHFQDMLHCLRNYAADNSLDDKQFEAKYGLSRQDFLKSIRNLITFMTHCETPEDKCNSSSNKKPHMDIYACACENELGLNSLIDSVYTYISYTLHELTTGDLYDKAKRVLDRTRQGNRCEEKLQNLSYFLEIVLDSQFKVVEEFFDDLKFQVHDYIPCCYDWDAFIKQLKTDILCVLNENSHAKRHKHHTILEYKGPDGKAAILNIDLLFVKDSLGKINEIEILRLEKEDSSHYEEAFDELFS